VCGGFFFVFFFLSLAASSLSVFLSVPLLPFFSPAHFFLSRGLGISGLQVRGCCVHSPRGESGILAIRRVVVIARLLGRIVRDPDGESAGITILRGAIVEAC